MTTDFIPDKAYLIKSKSLEEVKHGVKEWVRDNNLEIVIDKKNEIGADRKNFLLNYEIWVHAKLVPSNNGTIVIFGQEYNYFYSGFTVYGVINWINFGLGYYMQELRKNLIRFILNKKQIKIDFHKVQFNIFPFALAASIVFSLAILYSIEYIPENILIFTGILDIILLCILILLIFGFHIIHLLKIQKLSNLSEYKVEEYTGKIDLDQ